jgi:hypothetical protein
VPDELPKSIRRFGNDDDFLAWLANNPDGYFVNSKVVPTPNYLILHASGCPQFKGNGNWTKVSSKHGSTDRRALEDWAKSVGGTVILCRRCMD